MLLLTLEVRYEQDVVLTRQRARQLADRLGFDSSNQARLATAVSEIARNAFQYAQGGIVEFSVVEESPQRLVVIVRDRGSGIPHLQTVLDGRYTSTTGAGLGIIGTRRLMDEFEIESSAQGTIVQMSKLLPKRVGHFTSEQLAQIQQEMSDRSPQNPFEEIQRQNQELLRAMEELRQREEALMHLNRELEDTNRGVVALYAELDARADSLQKANEVKTRFLSNMSHEFRTPLNSIVSLSRILLDRLDGPLSSEQEKQVQFIRKAAESLTELVNDLLDLAKVEAGKLTLRPEHFEVSELFGTLKGMLRPLLAHNSSVALIFEEPQDLPMLHTDEGKVAQILRNFISNSLKYTEQGEVRVSAERTGDAVTFSVSDTGIGIAPADQSRIFEDFVQVESALQKRSKGTGLGLPLSRKLAELLGGNVALRSQIGVGSMFSATIPLVYPDAIEPLAIPRPTWQFDSTRLPILIVEDNPETLFAYEKYLQNSVYQPIAARTLEAATQALTQFQPIAIMLDILLEDQNTWTFLTDLRQNAATQTVPILVISVVDNENQVMTLGANGFLNKPVDRFSLLNKLNSLVKRDAEQTLLLIDDDPAARYVLKQLLADTPLQILEATSGSEGIRLAQTEAPQGIVLDLVMPEMNGTDVLNHLKRDRHTQTIPVILRTSQVLEPDEQKALLPQTIALLSKQTTASSAASGQLREALLRAGFVLEG